MTTNWCRIGALFGFLGVMLGAFGAHALRERLSPEQSGWWQTATQYLLIHSVALLLTGFCPLSPRARRLAGWAFSIGILLFAGTLYAMALGGPRILGAITPLGGTSLLAAWLVLAACSDSRTDSQRA